jgi:hypothetical protein
MKHLQHTYEICVCNMGEVGAGRFRSSRSELVASGGARARRTWERATRKVEVGARNGQKRGASGAG